MGTTLMEGRLGSLNSQSEAGAGGMGAGAESKCLAPWELQVETTYPTTPTMMLLT